MKNKFNLKGVKRVKNMYAIKSQHFKNRETNTIMFAFLLFLLSMNFFNMFYQFLFFIFMILVSVFLIQKKNLTININIMYIILFSFTYIISSALYYPIVINNVLRVCSFPMAYIVGTMLVNRPHKDKSKVIIKYITAMTFGTTILLLLTAATNIKRFGLFNGSRIMPDFWTGINSAVTGQAVLGVMSIGFAYYGFFICSKNKFIVRMLTLIGVLTGVIYNLFTASRSFFVLFCIVFSISFLCNMLIGENSHNKRIKVFFKVIFLVILLVLIYNINFLGLKDFIESMPLFDRITSSGYKSVTESGRINRLKYYWKNIWYYPFGGKNMRTVVGYSHFLWLDIYDVAGIVPCVLIILFNTKTLINVYRITKLYMASKNFSILIISMLSAFALQFTSEPIIEGVPWLLVLYCLICGMTDTYYLCNKEECICGYMRGASI